MNLEEGHNSVPGTLLSHSSEGSAIMVGAITRTAANTLVFIASENMMTLGPITNPPFKDGRN